MSYPWLKRLEQTMNRLEPGNVRPQDARLVVAISSRALFNNDNDYRNSEVHKERATQDNRLHAFHTVLFFRP